MIYFVCTYKKWWEYDAHYIYTEIAVRPMHPTHILYICTPMIFITPGSFSKRGRDHHWRNLDFSIFQRVCVCVCVWSATCHLVGARTDRQTNARRLLSTRFRYPVLSIIGRVNSERNHCENSLTCPYAGHDSAVEMAGDYRARACTHQTLPLRYDKYNDNNNNVLTFALSDMCVT